MVGSVLHNQNHKPRTASEAVVTTVVRPHDTNHLGTLFGGTLMAWIDAAAGICAMRYAQAERESGKERESGGEYQQRSAVVTAAVDALQFAQPVKLGWIVTAQARVNYVGHTSCEVGVRVVAEDIRRGVTVHAASAYLTMVAIDTRGRPCPLPPLLVQGGDGKRRQKAAETRRAMRLALQRRTRKGGKP